MDHQASAVALAFLRKKFPFIAFMLNFLKNASEAIMAILEFISDDDFLKEVENLLSKARAQKTKAEKTFNRNVIDPFGALFEAQSFPSHLAWRNSEMARQRQKTIQNHVGTFHQKILGHVEGWEDMNIGSIIDLVNKDKKIIAEVKNKYSTVTGGDLAGTYQALSELVSPKHSGFKGYCSYFVNIIPKKTERFDKPFTPSDKKIGSLCPINENIRIIDGASFYSLVTGRFNALREMHNALPDAIEFISHDRFKEDHYVLPNREDFMQYFNLAYGDE